jgi:hypothetical protein
MYVSDHVYSRAPLVITVSKYRVCTHIGMLARSRYKPQFKVYLFLRVLLSLPRKQKLHHKAHSLQCLLDGLGSHSLPLKGNTSCCCIHETTYKCNWLKLAFLALAMCTCESRLLDFHSRDFRTHKQASSYNNEIINKYAHTTKTTIKNVYRKVV